MGERPSRRLGRGTRAARALVGLLASSGLAACAAPRIDAPVPALLHADPADNPEGRVLLSIYGQGFGEPGPASAVRLRDPARRALVEIASRDASRVQLWSDTQIVLAAPSAAAAAGLRVQVRTPAGASLSMPTALWSYEHFDVPDSPDTNPVPVSIAVDAESSVWVNEEFHTEMKRLSASGAWSTFEIPRARGSGIFALTVRGDVPSPIATFGESVLVDARGRVFASESGGAPYLGPNPDHARILRFDPGRATPHVYNVPGDQNGVIGLGLEPASGRIWFTQARRSERVGTRELVALRARLTSFAPDEIPDEPGFDFTPAERCVRADAASVGRCSVTQRRRCLGDRDCVLAARVCAPEDREQRGCFAEHELPEDFDVFMPGHLLMHRDGTIWYAAYWGGNHIGRFDPASGRFQRFPMARPPGEARCDRSACQCFALQDPSVPACSHLCCLYLLLGRGPWQLAEDVGGDVVATAQEANALSRFAYARRDDPRCQTLEDGRNPCIREIPMPTFDVTREQLAGLTRDAQGTLWFTQAQNFESTPRALTSVGFLPAGGTRVTLLPPLSYFPFVSTGAECRPAGAFVGFHGAGIATDPRTGAVWFADLCRQRLGRVSPKARAVALPSGSRGAELAGAPRGRPRR